VVGNRDVEPFVPTLIGAMLRPTEASEAIHKLGAVTFVQARCHLCCHQSRIVQVQVSSSVLRDPTAYRCLFHHWQEGAAMVCVLLLQADFLIFSPAAFAV